MVNRFRSRLAYWLFTLFLLAVAGATGSWFVGADLVREQINMMARTSVKAGGSYVIRSIDVTGFPFAFDATIKELQLSGASPEGLWEWRASRLKARLSPWRSTAMTFDLSGNHKIRFRVGRRPLDFEIKMADAEGVFNESAGDAPHILKFSPKRITVRDTLSNRQFDAAGASVQIYRATPKKAARGDPLAGILLSLDNVVLPKEAEKILGRKMPRFALELQVLGGLPQAMARRPLSRWREEGGTLEIKNFDVAWGPAKINGTGTLGLDDNLQPEAALAASLTGYEKTVDALVAAGIVENRTARSVKLVLEMMARRSRPGQEPSVRIPMSIQNRVVYIGPARLTRLPMIRW